MPPGTRVALREMEGGLAISVPPAGLLRGSKGLIVFSVAWLVICGVIVGVTLAGGRIGRERDRWLLGLFAAAFTLVGLATLAVSVHMGRRRTMLAITPQTVGIRDISPFGTREQRLARNDIVGVSVGPTGVTVHNRPLMELLFAVQDGRTVGCLSQLTEPELHWLAAKLRRRLELAAAPSEA